MPTPQIPGMRPPAIWHYPLWLAAGALVGLAFLALLPVGPLFVSAAVGVGVLCLALRLVNRSVSAVPAGLAIAALDLAWLNRGGPGYVCRTTSEGLRECVGKWDPAPILIVAA
jgi:hypothetical protein